MKYEISMVIPGLPISASTLETKSLGGSETMGIQMAYALADLGHRVRCFGNMESVHRAHGVDFVPINQFLPYGSNVPHDVCIVQRSPDVLRNRIASKLNILWCHDMALGRQRMAWSGVLWNVDRVFVLSEFMKKQYQEVYPLPPGEEWLLHQTRNGIDLGLVPDASPLRNRKQIVCAARPERGVDNFAAIMGKLLEKDRDVRLMLCGYHNPVSDLRPFYEQVAQRFAPYAEQIKWVGELTKRELYKLYSESALYAYPTPSSVSPDFAEVSCISVMEAHACGLPVVTSAIGALPETCCPDASILIDGKGFDPDYADKFADAVLSYLHDDARWSTSSAIARQFAAERYSLTGLAKDWVSQFEQMISERNNSATRLSYHFYRMNDIMPLLEFWKFLEVDAAGGAMKLVEQFPDHASIPTDFVRRVRGEYGFIRSDEDFAAHYAKGGLETDARLRLAWDAGQVSEANFELGTERRFEVLAGALRARGGIKRILDYGCGHGWSTVTLARQFPESEWLGVDIDVNAVKWAHKFSDAFVTPPGRVQFVSGEISTIPTQDFRGDFDCAIASDVLEHCVSPIETLQQVEARVKTDGWVIVTVPYGPSEWATPNWENFRNHLWSFEFHDLEGIFGRKPGLEIVAVFDHYNSGTGEAVGFYLITYRADHKPLGAIDWDRKFRHQRPRQSTSLNMLCGPGSEKTLDWALDSIRWVADEIIIADCDMSPEARRIADRYKARLIKTQPPLVGGFDVSRNHILAASTGDWVFWLDSDERVCDALAITKYYRHNIWNGNAIHQHHLALDSKFDADTPVRLFRRAPYQGKTMAFYGRIHEHPELVMNEGPGPILVVGDVHIAHIGYLTEPIRRQRFARNHPLLQLDIKDYPNRLLQKHFVIRDNSLLNEWELRNNGGVVTDEIRRRAEEVIELYRKHFLGKPSYKNLDALGYYSTALAVLDRGIDLVFSVAARRGEQGDELNGGTRCRFGSVEEAQQEIGARIKDRMEPLLSKLW